MKTPALPPGLDPGDPLAARLAALDPALLRERPLSRVANALGWANLIYVGLVPSAAAFALISRYGWPQPPEITWWVLVIGGFAAVAVQLAMMVTYTRFPRSIGAALLVLLDGPLLAILSAWGAPDIGSFAIQAFLIDGLAVWLAIGVLSFQMRQLPALGIMAAMVLGALWMFWPYLSTGMPHTWVAIAPCVVGLGWSTLVNYRIASADDVVREGSSGATMAFILVLSFAWLAGLGGGAAWHTWMR